MRRGLLLALLLTLAGCGSSTSTSPTVDPGAVETAIAQTQAAAPTATTQPSATTEPTDAPTSTPKPSATPRPTATEEPSPTTAPAAAGEEEFALNFVGEQESGGVKIEIARVVVGTKASFRSAGPVFETDEIFAGKDVIVQLVFRVTNTSDAKRTVYVNQGDVVIGTEQINLLEYAAARATAGDDLGGDIFPGAVKIGVIWIGLERSTVPEVTKLIFGVNGPHDGALQRTGEDFYIEADLSNHEFQPLPDELK